MRCILCFSFSIEIICKKCQNSFLKPTLNKRKLFENFYVYSFYRYSEIEKLIKTKHTFIGSFIYKILAKNSFYQFSKEFNQKAYIVPIEKKDKDYYSHTAILANSMQNRYLKPLYNSLVSQNRVSYSTKNYEFRLKNPRDFTYTGPAFVDLIIVDDIVTTGLTLKEAYLTIKQKADPLFALVLADV